MRLLLLTAALLTGTTGTTDTTDAALLARLPLGEVSGLAVTGRGLYAHEDSGSGPRFRLLDRRGRVARTWSLPVRNVDWEDMAAAPDAAGRPGLWFADVGDNAARRAEVQVHRVAEPTGDGPGPVTTYRFRYADGPHDAEALLVLPGGRRVAVVTKELGAAGVYAAPLGGPGEVAVLRRVAEVPLQRTGTPGGPVGAFSQVLVTGGAVSPDGARVALRTYTDLYEWRLAEDLATTFAGPPTRTALPPTGQGEAVAYDVDGRAVLLASEGAAAPLHRLVLRDRPGNAPPAASGPGPAPSRAVPPPAHSTTRPRATGSAVAALLAAAGAVALAVVVLRRWRRG